MMKKSQKKTRIPKRLQGILWSQDVRTLRTDQDRTPIVHHILAYGDLKDIRWLLQTYSKRCLRDVFSRHPMKVYTRPSFQFAQSILGLRPENLVKKEIAYVKTASGRS